MTCEWYYVLVILYSEVLLSTAERQAEGSLVLRMLQRAGYGKRHR